MATKKSVVENFLWNKVNHPRITPFATTNTPMAAMIKITVLMGVKEQVAL